MTEDELKAINIQVETYCNADLKDEHLPAYRRFFIMKDYQQSKEAIELAFTGGYINDYVKKRIIPSPGIFQEFFKNIQEREETQKDTFIATPEMQKYNRGMISILIALLRIKYRTDIPDKINWGSLRMDSGQKWIDFIEAFWKEHGEGVVKEEIFFDTLREVSPDLAEAIKQPEPADLEPGDLPF